MSRCHRTRTDDGAATVWAAFVVAALVMIFGLMLVIGTAASARHRANSAADLSALAAAAYGPWGEQVACAQARWVVDQMQMRLGECRMNGWVARVEVITTVIGLGEITARATAGPVAEMSPGEENAGPIAGNGRPRAVSGITDGSGRVGERYRRPVDVRLERQAAFTRRSLPTSCRQAVTTDGGRAV
ncbi:Rv3654c family TadE-like protein [Kibdelosporangium aridum]|uniref:Helicase/secretion neighborhood TadE-like protein n=1 Tax=Kibdelosporangium aridum TaxID=2030 RepID=A0A1W2DQG9_KIBAR|nr:Rv3654c family TadE-like protein [Kibdelosporangium aridum]SMC99649.1 helicase/secretion neighborhood TadE-like protein [Kibdelosporangium aridum]